MIAPALLKPTGKRCRTCKRPLHKATCPSCAKPIEAAHSCFGGDPVVECFQDMDGKRMHGVTFVVLN